MQDKLMDLRVVYKQRGVFYFKEEAGWFIANGTWGPVWIYDASIEELELGNLKDLLDTDYQNVVRKPVSRLYEDSLQVIRDIFTAKIVGLHGKSL